MKLKLRGNFKKDKCCVQNRTRRHYLETQMKLYRLE